MELAIALISLATAVIGLVGTLAGKKQVIIVREGFATAEVKPGPGMTTAAERSIETAVHAPEMPPAPSPMQANLPPEQLHWYDRTGWLVLWFIFFWPIGLYGIAKSRAVKRQWKIATFVIFGILVFLNIMTEPTGFEVIGGY